LPVFLRLAYDILDKRVIIFALERLEFLPQKTYVAYRGVGVKAFISSVFGNALFDGVAFIVLGFGHIPLGSYCNVGIKCLIFKMLKAHKAHIMILLRLFFI
jgi:hypothetical protein